MLWCFYKCGSYSEKGLWSPGQAHRLLLAIEIWREGKKDGIPRKGNSQNEAMEWTHLKVEEVDWEGNEN